MKWGLPISITLLFWLLIGFLRRIEERYFTKKEVVLYVSKKYEKAQLSRIAVCIAAKNEEKGIKKTITSVKRNIPLKHCYVVSDGSTDKTAQIARKAGCNVMVTKKSLGKARALRRLIGKFYLYLKYDFILFLDADTQLDKNYVKNALPFFEDKRVACIAGYAKSQWRKPEKITFGNFLIAYRTRLYSALQFFYSYGQTWKYLNVTPIVPGFASMYRTSVLKRIRMSVKRMAIEDFHWTFQVRKKKLGLIAHHPSVFATAQDPTNFTDYILQVERWNLGFFHAVIYNGIWFSWFWFFLIIFMIEVFLATIFFGFLPFLIFFLIMSSYVEGTFNPLFTDAIRTVEIFYTLGGVLVGVFMLDYLLTIIVAVKDRRSWLLLYGLGFIFLRLIDGLILIGTALVAVFNRSGGSWISPKRS